MHPSPAQASIAESVAIGLQALHLMHKDSVAVTATSLEVWMMHASGALPQLSEDIARRTARGEPFAPAEITELFRRHCIQPDWQTSSRHAPAMAALLGEACGCVDKICRVTEEFRSTVEWARNSITSEPDGATLRTLTEVLSMIASKLLVEAAQTSGSLSALRRRLELNA